MAPKSVYQFTFEFNCSPRQKQIQEYFLCMCFLPVSSTPSKGRLTCLYKDVTLSCTRAQEIRLALNIHLHVYSVNMGFIETLWFTC
jgi:hypothetical protein